MKKITKLKGSLLILLVLLSCAGKQQPKISQAKEVTVYFLTNSAKLTPSGTDSLKSEMNEMIKHPKLVLVIEGYADKRGPQEYNLDLGDKRARAVKAFFVKQGISGERLITVTFGKSKQTNNPNNLGENRRVVVRNNK